jgi:uncharacterized membrane protein YidH (DUF202 family)
MTLFIVIATAVALVAIFGASGKAEHNISTSDSAKSPGAVLLFAVILIIVFAFIMASGG